MIDKVFTRNIQIKLLKRLSLLRQGKLSLRLRVGKESVAVTTNQLRFAELRENIRHNTQSENLGWGNLSEAVRHNQAFEGINWYQASNLADYQQGQLQNVREANQNLAAFQVGQLANAEDRNRTAAFQAMYGVDLTQAQTSYVKQQTEQAKAATAESQTRTGATALQGAKTFLDIIGSVSKALEAVPG